MSSKPTPSQIKDYLVKAEVPEEKHQVAMDCLAEAYINSRGLTWAKWKVRLFKARIGYEIDNLWNGKEQAWYPIAGHELKAPLTWSVLPSFSKD